MNFKIKETLILLVYLIGYLFVLSYMVTFDNKNNSKMKNIVFVFGSIIFFVGSLFCLQLLESFYLYDNIIQGMGIIISGLFLLFFIKAENQNKSIKRIFEFTKELSSGVTSNIKFPNVKQKLNFRSNINQESPPIKSNDTANLGTPTEAINNPQ